MARLAALLITCSLLVACGGEETQATGSGGSGNSAGVGGGPMAPDTGPRPFSCKPGELQQMDGSCLAAGVPASACGNGFVSDGLDGCEPVLPAQPCGAGLMALPGETSCRPVAACGGGPWSDIPVAANSQYVDAGYTGGNSNGSVSAPWTSIQAAVDAAEADAVIAIAPGSYVESVTVMGKPVKLWGKCPAEVELQSGNNTAAIWIGAGADGSEVHRLAVAPTSSGVLVESANDVRLDRLWLHDLAWIGVYAYAPASGDTASVQLEGSLIESVTSNGVYALGADVDIHDSVIRNTQPEGNGVNGYGVQIQYETLELVRAHLVMSHSVVGGNRWAGIRVLGGSATIEDSLIRDTEPQESDGNFGSGIHASADDSVEEKGIVTLRRSVVSGNRLCAVCGYDADVEVEHSTLLDTSAPPAVVAGAGAFTFAEGDWDIRPQLTMRSSLVRGAETFGVAGVGSDVHLEGVIVRDVVGTTDVVPTAGVGITLEPQTATLQATSADLEGVLVERARSVGILVVGSQADIEAAWVRDIASNLLSGMFGRGIGFEIEIMTGLTTTGALRNSLVEAVQEAGLTTIGSDATFDSVHVRDVTPSDVGFLGTGLLVQMSLETNDHANAAMSWSLVEDVDSAGVAVSGASLDLSHTAIANTRAHPDLNDYGDGLVAATIVFVDTNSKEPTPVTVNDVVIDSSARAGVSVFAAEVHVAGSWLSCNPIQLNGEAFEAFGYELYDDGGNTCLCGDTVEPCKVLSTSLEPPPLLQ